MIRELLQKLGLRLNWLVIQYNDRLIREKHKLPKSVSFLGVSFEGNITIGEHTYLNEFSRVDSGSTSRVVIGCHCAIGRYVHITSKTHSLIQPTTDEDNKTIKLTESDVTIGDYVWIGDKATILPGVSIGNYAVIGAHSMVNKDVKEFEIVGGIPAKHIKFNKDHYRYSGAQ